MMRNPPFLVIPDDLLLCEYECSHHEQIYIYLELVMWSLDCGLLLQHIPWLAKKVWTQYIVIGGYIRAGMLLSVVAPFLSATALSAPDFIIGTRQFTVFVQPNHYIRSNTIYSNNC
jgi:hypothetical protein